MSEATNFANSFANLFANLFATIAALLPAALDDFHFLRPLWLSLLQTGLGFLLGAGPTPFSRENLAQCDRPASAGASHIEPHT